MSRPYLGEIKMKRIDSMRFVALMTGLLLLGAPVMAEENETFTAEDAKSFLCAMYRSSFGDVEIAEDAITYYDPDGTVRCRCEYEFAGTEAVAFDGEEFDWYRFELKSGDDACSDYKHLIATEVHSHEGGMVHWHMRYGNTSFDDLINNPRYAMWYPTLAEENTTAEKVAEGHAEGAAMMGGMMVAARVPPVTLDTWSGTWVNPGMMLDDPAMNPVYEAMADAANAMTA